MIDPRHPLVAITATLSLLAAAPAAADDLTLRITGAEPDGGRLSVAVFESEAAASFPDSEAALARFRHDATREAVAVTLHALPPGDYAAVAYQDTNADGELTTNLTGIPTEPNGFSKGATGTMGPPDFDAAAVTLDQDGATAEIPLSN